MSYKDLIALRDAYSTILDIEPDNALASYYQERLRQISDKLAEIVEQRNGVLF